MNFPSGVFARSIDSCSLRCGSSPSMVEGVVADSTGGRLGGGEVVCSLIDFVGRPSVLDPGVRLLCPRGEGGPSFVEASTVIAGRSLGLEEFPLGTVLDEVKSEFADR